LALTQADADSVEYRDLRMITMLKGGRNEAARQRSRGDLEESAREVNTQCSRAVTLQEFLDDLRAPTLQPAVSGSHQWYPDQWLHPIVGGNQAIGHVIQRVPQPVDDVVWCGRHLDRDERPHLSMVGVGQGDDAMGVLGALESKPIAAIPGGQTVGEDALPSLVHIQLFVTWYDDGVAGQPGQITLRDE
jgi:hypothetical protein